MANLIIADPHVLFTSGLRLIIDEHPGFNVLATCIDAAEAVAVASEVRPDIVLMETHTPGLSPFEAVRQIKQHNPATKVCFLAGHTDERSVRQAMAVKVDGYVLKEESSNKLLEAIRVLERGGKWYSQRVANVMLSPTRFRSDTLTPRERETIKMLAEGNAVKEIAFTIGPERKDR